MFNLKNYNWKEEYHKLQRQFKSNRSALIDHRTYNETINSFIRPYGDICDKLCKIIGYKPINDDSIAVNMQLNVKLTGMSEKEIKQLYKENGYRIQQAGQDTSSEIVKLFNFKSKSRANGWKIFYKTKNKKDSEIMFQRLLDQSNFKWVKGAGFTDAFKSLGISTEEIGMYINGILNIMHKNLNLEYSKRINVRCDMDIKDQVLTLIFMNMELTREKLQELNLSDQIKFEKAENYGKIKSDTLINNCIDTYNKIKANPSDFYAVKENSGSDQQTMNGDNSQQLFEDNQPDNDQLVNSENSSNDDCSNVFDIDLTQFLEFNPNANNSQQLFENIQPNNDQSAICDNSNNDDTSYKQFFFLSDNSPSDFESYPEQFSETVNLQ